MYTFEVESPNAFTIDYGGCKVRHSFAWLDAIDGGLNAVISNIRDGSADGSDDPNEGDPDAEIVGAEAVKFAYHDWQYRQIDEPSDQW
jgi:hypothetical protein